MKKLTPVLAMLGLALATGTATAQTTFKQVDTNNDGMIEMAEMEAMYSHDSTVLYFKKYDMNHDGMVTPDEINEMMQMSDSMDDSMGSGG